jgi:hypothetical protein
MLPLLTSSDQILAVHRRRYPDGLICSTCGRLLASTGYQEAYTCAECRSDARERARDFERLRSQPRRPTEAQLAAATAYCTWCRRWFVGAGQTCESCRANSGNGWALEWQIPTAAAAATWLDKSVHLDLADPLHGLRAGSTREQTTPENVLDLRRRPRPRRVSEASLEALRAINAKRKALVTA